MESSPWFDQWRSRLTIMCGILLVLGFALSNTTLSYLSAAAGSLFALQSAWSSLREREIDVNLLMVLAAVGSVALGKPLEAAALLFLFSLSSTLESLALAKTQSAVEGLIKLRPETATLLTSDGEATIAVDKLKVGDRIKIASFAHVPTDAVVLEGESSVDQSSMTGESVPIARSPGELLIGGTQNLDGMLIAQVNAIHGETTLDKIVNLVQTAQENKGRGERISQWFGQRYTILVIAAFIIAFSVRLIAGEPLREAAYSALTLLVALSPCALVISTPAATLSALAWSARNGMLVRGGQFIEAAGTVQAIALDKTGTLTRGRHQLVEICMCSRPLVGVGGSTACVDESGCWHGESSIEGEAREVLRLAAIAESGTHHPIADAIIAEARKQGLVVETPSSLQSYPGLGAVAEVDGKSVAVGQLKLFERLGTNLPEDFVQHLNELRNQGLTVAVFQSGELIAGLGLHDEIRKDSRYAIENLRQLGMDPVAMLTGDTEQTAKAVAKEVGVTEICSQLMPEAKVNVVREIQSRGRRVLMVGDGINDAPSLVASDLGVAMGGLGSDVALNAADVVLMRDDLLSVPKLIQLGRKTNKIIATNLIFAAGVIGALALSSLFWKLPLPIAVVGHEGSTVLVILNGLRLLRGPGALPARVS